MSQKGVGRLEVIQEMTNKQIRQTELGDLDGLEHAIDYSGLLAPICDRLHPAG